MISATRVYDSIPIWIQNLAVSGMGLYYRTVRQNTRTVRRHLRFLLQSQYWSGEQFREYQTAQLRSLLEHAFENVPYYRGLRDEHGIQIDDIDSVEALCKLPILDRATVRSRAMELADRRIPPHRLWKGRTSGTTGSPLEYFFTPGCVAPRYAYLARLRTWAGVPGPLFPRRATFTGRSVVPENQSPTAHVYWRRNLAENSLLFSASHISSGTAPHYAEALRRFRPAVIEGYPSAITAVARISRSRGIRLPSVRAVLTTAETLLPEHRRDIERAFDCRVFDHYGAKEPSCFWSECEHGTLHVHPEYGISEILTSDGTPAAPGQKGEIVVTSFLARAMPLIRYRIGDVAVAGDGESCACGREMPTVGRLVGRTDDTVSLPGGRFFQRFSCAFTASRGIVEAQVVQEEEDRIRILVVPDRDFTRGVERSLLADLRRRVGPETDLEIVRVAKIPRGPNGKFKGVVSHVKHLMS